MAGSFTQAIDNLQDYNVVAQTFCKKIVVRENYNAATPPTADLIQVIAGASSVAVRIPQGTDAVYEKGSHYRPGEVAGTIRTAAGSITIQRIET